MKRILATLVLVVTVVGLSGCFPVLFPCMTITAITIAVGGIADVPVSWFPPCLQAVWAGA